MASLLVHAARATVRRTRRGLYAGKTVRSGNSVSEDGGNRNRRGWKPNAQNKALYSEALDRMVRLRVTTAAIRHIDKVGGLDEYLLHTPAHKLGSDVGEQLKQHILAALRMRAQAAQPSTFVAGPSASAEPSPEEQSVAPEAANAHANGADSSDEPGSSSSSSSGVPDEGQDEAPLGLWAPGRATAGKSRYVRQPEHQVLRWDGSLKTVPQRSLRRPNWLVVRS